MVAPTASVPKALTNGPFTAAEARRAGLSARQLQGKSWQRVGRGLYVRAGYRLEPLARLTAAARTLPGCAAFAGRTAAWLHGLDLPPCEPIEAVVPRSHPLRARAGVMLHRAQLADHDVVVRRGLRVTTIVRTLSDLAGRMGAVEAVVLIDAAMGKGLLTIGQLTTNRRLGKLTDLVDGRSDSPMESRLRVLLMMSGLSRPESQAKLRDAVGSYLARVDLSYPRRGWRSNPTGPHTATAWRPTTAVRTGC